MSLLVTFNQFFLTPAALPFPAHRIACWILRLLRNRQVGEAGAREGAKFSVASGYRAP